MKKLIRVLLILLFLSVTASAYLNLYPASFNKRIDGRGAGEEFVLYNPGASPVKYVIYAEEEEKSSRESMVTWMEIYPKNITLKPGEEKKVKLYIKAPASAKRGEYGAVIGFKEVYVPGGSPKESSLKILTDLKLHISGYVGDLKPVISAEGLHLTESGLAGVFKNTGERRADIEIFLSDSSEKDMHFFAATRIQKGESLDLTDIKGNPSQNIKKYVKIIVTEKDSNIRLGEFKIN